MKSKPVKTTPKKKPFLLNVDLELLEKIRRRAEDLDQDVGQYFCALARADIAKGGPLQVHTKSAEPVRYPEHTPQNFNEPDDGAATARPHEQSRAEEGKSPPPKRKAG